MKKVVAEKYRDIDFSRAKRGAVVKPEPGKTKISIRLDNAVIEHFRSVVDKAGAAAYERLIRPAAYRWPEWIERCRTQAVGALAALDAADWPTGAGLDQSQITTACLLFYLKMNAPELVPPGQYRVLDALRTRCEGLEAFQATAFSEYKVPRAD